MRFVDCCASCVGQVALTNKRMKTPYVILICGLLLSTSSSGQNNSPDQLRPPISILPTADLASVGMRQDTITKLIQLINTNPPNDFRGLVVIKNNKLVVEEYFNTYWRETIH